MDESDFGGELREMVIIFIPPIEEVGVSPFPAPDADLDESCSVADGLDVSSDFSSVGFDEKRLRNLPAKVFPDLSCPGCVSSVSFVLSVEGTFISSDIISKLPGKPSCIPLSDFSGVFSASAGGVVLESGDTESVVPPRELSSLAPS